MALFPELFAGHDSNLCTQFLRWDHLDTFKCKKFSLSDKTISFSHHRQTARLRLIQIKDKLILVAQFKLEPLEDMKQKS
jgi:hypothetical protein